MKNDFKLNSIVSLRGKQKNTPVAWIVGVALIASFDSFTAKASDDVQLVTKEQLSHCEKIGVYRGKADQPLFSKHSLKQLEQEAMQELIEEARRADATHLVKGFVFRVGSAEYIEMVFQFGTAYDCSSKK